MKKCIIAVMMIFVLIWGMAAPALANPGKELSPPGPRSLVITLAPDAACEFLPADF